MHKRFDTMLSLYKWTDGQTFRQTDRQTDRQKYHIIIRLAIKKVFQRRFEIRRQRVLCWRISMSKLTFTELIRFARMCCSLRHSLKDDHLHASWSDYWICLAVILGLNIGLNFCMNWRSKFGLHLKVKVKCAILLLEFRRGAHLPS